MSDNTLFIMVSSHNDDQYVTYWMYKSNDVRIPVKEARALLKLLRFAGAIQVWVLSNGAIEAKFRSYQHMHRAMKNVIGPLEILFGSHDLRSAYGRIIW